MLLDLLLPIPLTMEKGMMRYQLLHTHPMGMIRDQFLRAPFTAERDSEGKCACMEGGVVREVRC